MSLRGKLNRMKQHIITANNSEVAASIEITEQDKTVRADDDIPYMAQWRDFGAKPYHFDGQYILERKVSYPLNHIHGVYRFSELQHVINLWKEKQILHPLSSANRKKEDLVFFDTETTGLGTGTGNTIFLLGVAKIVGAEVTVKQYFLPGPGHEVALYHSFLTDLNDLKSLVTYNGKAFDWPQVKTRHTLIRDAVPNLPEFGHFDLLHASRRLWKTQLPSVRLSIVEKEILGIEREGDTPGYLAPMLYFDYLKDQDPTGLFGVIKHNEMDVLSLITLYIHLSKRVLGVDSDYTSPEEQFEIARWYDALGHLEEASFAYELAANRGGPVRADALKGLAYLHKKKQNYTMAITMFEQVLEQKMFDVDVPLELAKLYEHYEKEYDKAIHYAEMAFERWKSTNRLLKKKERSQMDQFMKRIERLEGKLNILK